MIDFLQTRIEIKNYIETHFADYTNQLELPLIDKYCDDFIDFDKYKQNNILFYNFNNFDFSDLSNESEYYTHNFSIFLAVRGANAETLNARMTGYATAFYKMFEDSGNCFDGISDYGIIQNVSFYPAATGANNIKVCQMEIILKKEV